MADGAGWAHPDGPGWSAPPPPPPPAGWYPPPAGWQPGPWPQQPGWGQPPGLGQQPPHPPTSRRRPLAIVLLVAIAVVLLGDVVGVVRANTGPSTPAGATASPAHAGSTPVVTPAGYRRHPDPVDKFSIAVPATWHVVDASSPNFAEALRRLAAANPGLPTDTATAQQHIRFYAVGAPAGGSQRQVVDVTAIDAPGADDSDLPDAVGGVVAGLRNINGTVTSNQAVTIAGHAARELLCQATFHTPSGGSLSVQLHIGLLIANERLYAVEISAPAAAVAAITSSFAVG